MKKNIIISFIVFTVILFTGCSDKTITNEPNKEELQKITFSLDWTPNTNHTGIYVALDKGFFNKEGLDVEIIQPGQSTANQLVATNNAQFGIGYQEGITMARLQDLPLVSIGAVIQHNTSAFASPISKGIVTPKDFEGKTYAGWGSPIEYSTIKALMDLNDADADTVTILTTGATDFFATTEKNADFAWIFYGWDGIAAKLKGKELNTIMLKDFDPVLDYYTPVIMTNETMINENSETIKQFMKAATEGYTYAIDNPEESANILLKYAPELDKELVIASQKYLSTKYIDDASKWGVQKKEIWENYMNWLYERDLIENQIDVDKAFTNEFLPN